MYGIDIISKRLSRLDKEVIRFALEGKGIAVEFGAGYGNLSLILSLIGYKTYVYDLNPPEKLLKVKDLLNLNLFVFKRDIRDITSNELPEGIRIFVAERILHFLRYEECLRILKIIAGRMEKGGRMFLSFSGLNSPLGENYKHKDLPIERRFCEPSPEVSTKFSIDVPICLYTLEDVRNLMRKIKRVNEIHLRETPFGNVEGIFSIS